MLRRYFTATPQERAIALQYAMILDLLDQEGLNAFILEYSQHNKVDMALKAMEMVTELDWNQEQLRPQLEARFRGEAA